MMTGTINIVTDMQLALQWANCGCKVVFIGDIIGKSLPPQFIPLPMLAPSVEVVNIDIMEGPTVNYINAYTAQLSSYECYMSMIAIIAQVVADRNVILYIEEGDNMHHGEFLITYFLNTFGIAVGTEQSPFCIVGDPSVIIALVYAAVDNVVTLNDLLSSVSNPRVLLDLPALFPYAADIFDKMYRESNGEITPDTIAQVIYTHQTFNNCGNTNLIVRTVP